VIYLSSELQDKYLLMHPMGVWNLPGNPANNAVKQNVVDQVNNLRDLDPILHKKYLNDEILIVGAV
jgi:carbonic anhydrase